MTIKIFTKYITSVKLFIVSLSFNTSLDVPSKLNENIKEKASIIVIKYII